MAFRKLKPVNAKGLRDVSDKPRFFIGRLLVHAATRVSARTDETELKRYDRDVFYDYFLFLLLLLLFIFAV